MADTRGFFGRLADSMANSQGGLSLGGMNIRSPVQILGGWFGGQNAQQFADTHGVGLSESGQQRLDASLWGQPLMSGGEESAPQGGMNYGGARPSGHGVTYFNSTPQFSQTGGAATTLAGAGRGQTVGTMSMGQLSEMLNAGVGQNNRAAMMTPGREMNENRANARRSGQRPEGMSVRDWIMQ